MRYSARAKNIQWKGDSAVRGALAFLTALLDGDEPGILRHRLAPGQGLIANNVLHNRTGFSDGDGTSRLLYRARFLDRIAGTSPPTD
jgi:alpha-ketoglutarate-dependent taurine dioxygenase